MCGQDQEVADYRNVRGACSFEDQCVAVGKLLKEGKIRAWGMCNDNAFGLTVCAPLAGTTGCPAGRKQHDTSSLAMRTALPSTRVAVDTIQKSRDDRTCPDVG